MSPQTERSGQSSGGGIAVPAAVYFAKAPVPGAVKTRLCPPLTTEEACALYEVFLGRVVHPVPGARTLVYGWPGGELDRLRATVPGLVPVAGGARAIELRPQVGADLWARMIDCFAGLFAEGHRPVVIRNTDSPDLEMELVTEAIERCEMGTVVLGPDLGGGYYLVALAAPCPELFAGLDEGASTVFEATRRRAGELGLRVEILPERPDVDTFEDLVSMWRRRMGPEPQ